MRLLAEVQALAGPEPSTFCTEAGPVQGKQHNGAGLPRYIGNNFLVQLFEHRLSLQLRLSALYRYTHYIVSVSFIFGQFLMIIMKM